MPVRYHTAVFLQNICTSNIYLRFHYMYTVIKIR